MHTPTTTDAAELLRDLLAIPDERPGAWEAPHVEALAEDLRDVLHAIEEADREEPEGVANATPERTGGRCNKCDA